MSIQIFLRIEDQEFVVDKHYFSFFQKADETGRPYGKPLNRTFDFVIPASKDTTFFEWAVAPQMIKNCKIIFTSRYGMSKSTTIELLDTHCLFYKLKFNHQSQDPLQIYASLAPATVLVNGQQMISHWWRKTDPAIIGAPVMEEQREPEMLESYYEDKKGNRIPDHKIRIGDEVYLVIKTSNAIGKSISINLADNIRDFEYNGEILENDILEGITINADIQRVTLKVVPQQTTTS